MKSLENFRYLRSFWKIVFEAPLFGPVPRLKIHLLDPLPSFLISFLGTYLFQNSPTNIFIIDDTYTDRRLLLKHVNKYWPKSATY